MIHKAITELKEKKGSSKQQILKYILQHFKVGGNILQVNSHLRQALKRGVTSGALKQVKGTGASGSFRIGDKAAKPKKAKKPAAKKAKKSAGSPKKASASKPKKARKPKSPKKAAASGAAKKTTAKKPKSPKKPKASKPKKTKSPKKAGAKKAAKAKPAAAKA